MLELRNMLLTNTYFLQNGLSEQQKTEFLSEVSL